MFATLLLILKEESNCPNDLSRYRYLPCSEVESTRRVNDDEIGDVQRVQTDEFGFPVFPFVWRVLCFRGFVPRNTSERLAETVSRSG